MQYRPEIDGLRTIAVLPVILFHAHVPGVSGGFIGVDVFFVISGFLITSILLGDLEKGRYSLVRFYERRARRILPALFVVVLCTVPAAWAILLPPDLKDFGQSVIATMGFASNLLFWRESGYFDTAAEFKPLLHTWSLAVEEQFYILFPLLLALLFRRARRWVWPVFAMLAVLSLVAAQWGTRINPSGAFYLLPTRGWELLIGTLAAFALRGGPLRVPPVLAQGLSAVGLLAVLGSIVWIDSSVPFPGLYALPATLGTALILLFARPGTWVQALLALRPMVGIGLISYSAYLWHQPLIALYRYRVPDAPVLGVLLAGLLALPLAYLTWRFVETPFRHGARAATQGASQSASLGAFQSGVQGPSRVLGGAVAGLVLCAALGAGLTLRGGWETRFDPHEVRVFTDIAQGKAYVPTRFNQLQGAEFVPGDPRRKVLVIGDSYGQDLVNALAEAGLTRDLALSSHYIPARCGNLMLDEAALAAYRIPSERVRCAGHPGYTAPGVLARMAGADEIWLVSSWNARILPLLEESLAAIRARTDTPVVVVGRKHFGLRALRGYHGGGVAALTGAKRVPDGAAMVQAQMAQSIPPLAPYLDLQMLLCGRYDACANGDAAGRPLSFDGTHLTPAGAAHLGALLRPVLTGPDWLRGADGLTEEEEGPPA